MVNNLICHDENGDGISTRNTKKNVLVGTPECFFFSRCREVLLEWKCWVNRWTVVCPREDDFSNHLYFLMYDDRYWIPTRDQ